MPPPQLSNSFALLEDVSVVSMSSVNSAVDTYADERASSGKTMDVAITVLSLDGVVAKHRKSAQKRRLQSNPSATIVASFSQNNLSKDRQVFLTHIPSLPVSLTGGTGASTITSTHTVSTSSSSGVVGGDDGGKTLHPNVKWPSSSAGLSTLQIQRRFTSDGSKRYEPEPCPINVSISCNGKMALLGKATLIINGDERGECSMNVPVTSSIMQSKTAAKQVKKIRNSIVKKETAEDIPMIKVNGDDAFKFGLEGTATLRVLVNVSDHNIKAPQSKGEGGKSNVHAGGELHLNGSTKNDYGSCEDQRQRVEITHIIDNTQSEGGDNPAGENPRIYAIAVTVLLLLGAAGLFVWHIHNTPLPLGFSQAMRNPLLRSRMTMAASTLKMPDPNAYPRRPFITKNGRNITLPVLGFPSVALAQYPNPEDQAIANEAVRHAVEELDISYFDVAPEYGDGVAQERLGPALKPYRNSVFLAAKTMYRDAVGSATDLVNTLRALQTDHLDLYQFHSISTERDVEQILGRGGAMDTFKKAKKEGKIRAIGFSAHSEPMAIRMIESGLVDTCMFPVNFNAYHYGGVGQKVLDAAIMNNVGVIALKSGAQGRLTPENGDGVTVPEAFKHIPEWKRREMIDYPVVTSKHHHTWYQPENDPIELKRLVLWSLNQPGVTAVLPPGSLELLDGISDLLRGKSDVPTVGDSDLQHMMERYDNDMNIVPIFHNRSVSGTKVST